MRIRRSHHRSSHVRFRRHQSQLWLEMVFLGDRNLQRHRIHTRFHLHARDAWLGFAQDEGDATEKGDRRPEMEGKGRR